ncbi:type II toxin-antitoxin system HicA family toxin [Seleniivibrio sp.]|uniref:type II toxin-antitoxin system HicA family toxin n=1 Tax=Seleniivibrio sp. TaxID=2898801 RepID=UPI0025FA3F6C|nr:type II toxin-antitoxin system HicA family toxin [Seleniivibrio sp.]MCD8554978.1 type II toxin-antitoxin system HicA family toxin [Seleniivibrio sp.]
MKEKDIQKIINSPQKVKFSDLDKLLQFYGYIPRQPKGGSSHFVYVKEGEQKIITVPFKRPYVKDVYVKHIIKLLRIGE